MSFIILCLQVGTREEVPVTIITVDTEKAPAATHDLKSSLYINEHVVIESYNIWLEIKI